jgi:hypothetical protein
MFHDLILDPYKKILVGLLYASRYFSFSAYMEKEIKGHILNQTLHRQKDWHVMQHQALGRFGQVMPLTASGTTVLADFHCGQQ